MLCQRETFADAYSQSCGPNLCTLVRAGFKRRPTALFVPQPFFYIDLSFRLAFLRKGKILQSAFSFLETEVVSQSASLHFDIAANQINFRESDWPLYL
jgi:hypothetical protein